MTLDEERDWHPWICGIRRNDKDEMEKTGVVKILDDKLKG